MSLTHPGHLPRQLSLLARGVRADPVRPAPPAAPAPRVRQQVRDGMAVVAFSAVASTGVALALLLLVQLAG